MLPFAINPSFVYAHTQSGIPATHPAGLLPSSNATELQGSVPGAPPANYDEQLGESFTQSFTSIGMNVTAVAQADSYGYGPAYLVNGLSDTGYWYQVGLSYDWPHSNGGYNAGFNMVYAVFDPSGNLIFPSSGGAGIVSFSGPVNTGDKVYINLYFTNNGQVAMVAVDQNTGAYASETYSAEGATYFQGQNGLSSANSKGFFTGLMTEWYHVNPYYGSEQQVTYYEQTLQFTSAWLWIDEWDTNTSQTLFSSSTSGPVTLTSQLYPYSSNGATEYASTNMFITGPISMNVTISSYSKSGDAGVPITDSFSSVVSGGVPPYYYYIFVNGKMVFNSTTTSTNYNSEFTVNNLGAGNYSPTFEVVDSIGETVTLSNFVFITISSGPSISIKMPVTTYDAGQTLDISASASEGTPPYTVTYYIDGVSVGNNIPVAPGPGTYQVYARLTDSAGRTVDSNVLTFTVNPDPVISISVPHTVYDAGQLLTVSSSASQGTPPYSISYYLNGNPMSGGTATLATPGTYRVSAELVDSLGYYVGSNTITVTVNPDPSINGSYSTSSSNFFYSNNIVIMEAPVIGGTSPYTYAWYLNGQEVATTTTPSYTYHLASMGQNTLNVTVTDATGYTTGGYAVVNFSYNYTDIAITAVIAIAVIIGGIVAIRHGKKGKERTRQPASEPDRPPAGVAIINFRDDSEDMSRVLTLYTLGAGFMDRKGMR
jgi:hypothetical protein